MTKDPIHQDKAEHVKVDQHFINKLENKSMELQHIPTTDYTEDMFTKALTGTQFEF